MYTKQETSRQKQAFWTTFGKYMQPILSADGMEVNWVNYKTGIPGLYFRMDADTKVASITIELSQNDSNIQRLYYDEFLQRKNILNEILGEEWDWQLLQPNEYGSMVSTISKKITNVNIHRMEDWPQIISFLKPRIIALDEFWSVANIQRIWG
ncbi:MAG: DUF4268 domain-containing protein [Flavipsychrobacter sp.]